MFQELKPKYFSNECKMLSGPWENSVPSKHIIQISFWKIKRPTASGRNRRI